LINKIIIIIINKKIIIIKRLGVLEGMRAFCSEGGADLIFVF